ncbi:MAG: vitamin K epoxide reductase family protein [Candidatus Magasanikbacteria bacterium]
MWFYILVLILSFSGFLLSIYINQKKRGEDKLVCPVGASCKPVIKSKYSKFFGVNLEIWGILYYFSIFVYYSISFAFLDFPLQLDLFVFGLTFASFLFSLYLTFIQAFVLKEWCSWCLCSAFCSTMIFFFSSLILPEGVLNVVLQETRAIWGVHLISVALGVGVSTVLVILFMRFLRDLRVSDWESHILRIVFDLGWLSLLVYIASGGLIYLPGLASGVISPLVFLKFVVLTFVVANSAVLHFILEPKLEKISSGKPHNHQEGELLEIHKASFGLGGTLLTSWYFLFFISILRTVPLGIFSMILVYISVLLFGLFISQIAEKHFRKAKE